MKEKFYLQKEFYWTLLTSILIIAVSVISHHEKVVWKTGNIKIYGIIGTIFAIGLLLKWKFVREILTVITLAGILGIPFIYISTKELTLSNGIYLAALIVIFYLLLFSKHVRKYLKT